MSDSSATPAVPNRVSKWVPIGCLALLVLVAGGCAAMVAFGNGSSVSRRTDAKIWCEQYVKDRLKSPTSADFSGEDSTEHAADGTYVVTGAVDSQNSFGAKIRNTFTCTVRKQASGDLWDLVSLTGLTN